MVFDPVKEVQSTQNGYIPQDGGRGASFKVVWAKINGSAKTKPVL